jgi:hypothetical protein
MEMGSKPGERFYPFAAQFDKDKTATESYRNPGSWNGSYYKLGSSPQKLINVPEYLKD